MMPATNATTAAFWSSSVIRRQYAVWERECACTRAMHREYKQRHASLDRLIVLDGSTFRWEGLGNSGTRWMGLLRWGYATGRAVFLQISPLSHPVRLDPGEYFIGWNQVDWHWGAQRAAIRKRLTARGVRPVVLEYSCARRRAPGCAIARLRFPKNRSVLAELPEPFGLLEWMRSPASPPWIRLVLAQQDSLEHSYSRPEALRTVTPLTRCPVASAASFSTRERCLKCETFAFMQPRRKLVAALVPLLPRLEPYDAIVGVHLRTGYADWAFRNDDTFFPSRGGAGKHGGRGGREAGGGGGGGASAPGAEGAGGGATVWDMDTHWRKLDEYFQDCRTGQAGPVRVGLLQPHAPACDPADPCSHIRVDRVGLSTARLDSRGRRAPQCFNWHNPHMGSPPTTSDALRCGHGWPPPERRGRRAQLWRSLAGAPEGFLASMLLCAARLGQAMTGDDGPMPARLVASSAGPHAVGSAEAPPPRRRRTWGLLILSDSPAFPSLATRLPALRGRAVNTAGAGAGQLGHSSFARSCSARTGCQRGRDPNGAWTRSLVDFYLAGVADGFVKGLFTSFLYSTMRRDLLCCEGGAFVQWLGWYNLSRSHRDLPMHDRAFLKALTTT